MPLRHIENGALRTRYCREREREREGEREREREREGERSCLYACLFVLNYVLNPLVASCFLEFRLIYFTVRPISDAHFIAAVCINIKHVFA